MSVLLQSYFINLSTERILLRSFRVHVNAIPSPSAGSGPGTGVPLAVSEAFREPSASMRSRTDSGMSSGLRSRTTSKIPPVPLLGSIGSVLLLTLTPPTVPLKLLFQLKLYNTSQLLSANMPTKDVLNPRYSGHNRLTTEQIKGLPDLSCG